MAIVIIIIIIYYSTVLQNSAEFICLSFTVCTRPC